MHEIVAAQPRTIVVFIAGGVVSSPWIAENAQAVLFAAYGGELGADALVDVLTGLVNPSGRLPSTIYYPNITTRDIRDMDLSSAGGITHGFFTGPVLYAFGSGLSYSRWETAWAGVALAPRADTYFGVSGRLEWLGSGAATVAGASSAPVEGKFNAADLAMLDDKAIIRLHRVNTTVTAGVALHVNVTNRGRVAGDRVLLLFSDLRDGSDLVSTRPRVELVQHCRMFGVAPGETRNHVFLVPWASLGIDIDRVGAVSDALDLAAGGGRERLSSRRLRLGPLGAPPCGANQVCDEESPLLVDIVVAY